MRPPEIGTLPSTHAARSQSCVGVLSKLRQIDTWRYRAGFPPRDLVDHTPGRPQQWPDVDGDIKESTDQIIERLGLLRGVVGVYLHGSLAMGGFYRPKSDLDLLVVVDSPLTDEHRRSLATDMLGRNNVRRFEAFAHSGHRRLQAADSQRCSYRIRRRAS